MPSEHGGCAVLDQGLDAVRCCKLSGACDHPLEEAADWGRRALARLLPFEGTAVDSDVLDVARHADIAARKATKGTRATSS